MGLDVYSWSGGPSWLMGRTCVCIDYLLRIWLMSGVEPSIDNPVVQRSGVEHGGYMGLGRLTLGGTGIGATRSPPVVTMPSSLLERARVGGFGGWSRIACPAFCVPARGTSSLGPARGMQCLSSICQISTISCRSMWMYEYGGYW